MSRSNKKHGGASLGRVRGLGDLSVDEWSDGGGGGSDKEDS